ncbi:MAG: GNAT family N-acetyltransferase [Erysipelotrichaceae bacterium]|nr:GNAT family N-acetyltransferase [Erysipelotrichaceae bacterium]
MGYYTLRASSIVYQEKNSKKLKFIPVVELSRLAIDRPYQRLGYGSEIILKLVMDKAMEVKKYIGCIAILVFAATEHAQLFYESIGFEDIGVYDEKGNNTFMVNDDGFNVGCHVLLLTIQSNIQI